MPGYRRQRNCLSSEQHDITDHLLHFLGCLEYGRRNNFFDETEKIWQDELQHYQEYYPDANLSPEERVRKKREAWKKDCEKEFTRIEILRQTIRQDPHDCHLDVKIRESSKAWRESRNYQARVRDRQPSPRDLLLRTMVPMYNLEREIGIPVIQYQPRANEFGAAAEVDDKGWMDEQVPEQRVWGQFPNQKTTLDMLWGKDSTANLLHRDRYPERIKYFHIPSNNMMWAEHAIARYFAEERPDQFATQREFMRAPKTKASVLLRDQIWQGQLHGGEEAPPHARHMRPMCVTASSETEVQDVSPQHIVLFMPFLHWETSRQREVYVRTIKDTVARNKMTKARNQEEWRRDRIEDRIARGLATPTSHKRSKPFARRDRAQINRTGNKYHPSTPATKNYALMDLIATVSHGTQVRADKNGRLLIYRALGQYLLDAARLYEGMSNYRDKKVLEHYIGGDTPLHPRRTLGEALYPWKLKTKTNEHRNQVVYRATVAPPGGYHSYDPDTGMWPDHVEWNIEGVCVDCTSRIKKVSKVIMVDQLWMWILDNKTIITCFPDRYGINKSDDSGIHSSIRRRLSTSPQIRTVFDLGLIIFDECSNAFLGGIKMDPGQPQVMDTFEKSIEDVLQKQKVAFERLWPWIERARRILRSHNPLSSQFALPFLDTNLGTRLDDEVSGIIEELDMMLHITKCHRTTLQRYVRNVDHFLDQYGEFRHAREEVQTGRSSYSGLRHSEKYRYEPTGEEPREKVDKRNDYSWFRFNSDEVNETIEGRIAVLSELRVSAAIAAQRVGALSELERQKESIIQEWQSVKQARETGNQSRSIMMFTLVNIVFIPLSFMSSIFGMNSQEFSGSGWPIRDEIRLIVMVSALVVAVTIFWAYSNRSRAIIFAIYKRATAWVSVTSGLFIWTLPSAAEIVENAERASENVRQKAWDRRRIRNLDRKRGKKAKEKKAKAQKAKEAKAKETRRRSPSNVQLQDEEMGLELGHF